MEKYRERDREIEIKTETETKILEMIKVMMSSQSVVQSYLI